MQYISQLFQFFASDLTADFGLWQVMRFAFALITCAILSWLLGKTYIKYGNSLSNRKAFAKNFLVLATTTMFIITVVKSSLALSLGLVGALSIVRFRSAIKEPEELTYLFLTIAIGLGCGAGQILVTLLSFVFIVLFIIAGKGKIFGKKDENSNGAGMTSYILIVCESKPGALQRIIDILASSSNAVKLKRTDEANSRIEASFYIDFDDWKQFEKMRDALLQFDGNMKITFMDTSKDY